MLRGLVDIETGIHWGTSLWNGHVAAIIANDSLNIVYGFCQKVISPLTLRRSRRDRPTVGIKLSGGNLSLLLCPQVFGLFFVHLRDLFRQGMLLSRREKLGRITQIMRTWESLTVPRGLATYTPQTTQNDTCGKGNQS
jgi:hypothetical protein